MCPWPQPCRRPQVGEANPRQKWKTLPKTITKRAGGRTPALQLGFELSSNPGKNEKKKIQRKSLVCGTYVPREGDSQKTKSLNNYLVFQGYKCFRETKNRVEIEWGVEI
jgi:hypothetical protein